MGDSRSPAPPAPEEEAAPAPPNTARLFLSTCPSHIQNSTCFLPTVTNSLSSRGLPLTMKIACVSLLAAVSSSLLRQSQILSEWCSSELMDAKNRPPLSCPVVGSRYAPEKASARIERSEGVHASVYARDRSEELLSHT